MWVRAHAPDLALALGCQRHTQRLRYARRRQHQLSPGRQHSSRKGLGRQQGLDLLREPRTHVITPFFACGLPRGLIGQAAWRGRMRGRMQHMHALLGNEAATWLPMRAPRR